MRSQNPPGRGVVFLPKLPIERETPMVKLLAPAKVNLFLRILAQERSGYHQLETLFCRLKFGDTLELERAARGIDLEVEGGEIGPPEENLAHRAARAFLEASGHPAGVRILLRKRVPVGAGLGGGSSDAGATLLGLAKLFPGAVAGEDLLDIAGSLGSDVPFFLTECPMAVAWGRGDRIRPLPTLPEAPVLLALPPLEIPTSWAYGRLAAERTENPPPMRPMLFSQESLSSWDRVAELAENDFEAVMFREHPSLERIRDAIADAGSFLTLLSGSGAAIFGLFRGPDTAGEARGTLEGMFPETRFVVTRTDARSRDPRSNEGVEPGVGL